MTIAQAAALAVLAQAVLDLAGLPDARSQRLRDRLQQLDARVLALADQARRLTGYRSPDLTTPLVSVFSLVNAEPKSPPLFLNPAVLTERPQYPTSGSLDPGAFRTAMEAVKESLRTDMALLSPQPNALLFLLEKHAWAVSGGAPGLAFADVARLTAAVAGALAHGCERFCLVSADLSGVQRFIYTIGAKGALKGLRARSFFLELIAKETARRSLERLGLTRANLIYVGGGHLYLLAPASPATHEAIAMVKAELNQWLLDELGGKVYLAMGAADFDLVQMAPGAEGVPQVWADAAAFVGQDKSRRFLTETRGTAFWEPWDLKQATCAVCYQETDCPVPLHPPEGDEEAPEVCPLCKALNDLGGLLPRARYLVVGASGLHADIAIAGTGYYLCETAEAVRRVPERLDVMAFNALDADVLAVEPDAYPIWLGAYLKTAADGRSVATFKELAEASAGQVLLGVLRMDVDHLGWLFSSGLPQGSRDFGRTAGISGALTRFFKLHLNSLCKGDGGSGFQPLRMTGSAGARPVSMVYAGGDDLFVVGAWDQTLELAFDIRTAFRRYCGERLTLSAGMVAHDYMLPLHRLAEDAGDAEHAAKQNGRDSISPLFLGPELPNEKGRAKAVALKWDEAAEIIMGFLRPALGPLGSEGRPGTRLSRKLTYGLLGLADYWVEHGRLYLPRLAYLLARADKDLRREPAWEGLQAFLMRYPREMAQFSPFVRWLDLIGRGGNEHE